MITQEYWLSALALIVLATALVVLLFCLYVTHRQAKRRAKRDGGGGEVTPTSDGDAGTANHVVIGFNCGSESTLNDPTVTVHTGNISLTDTVEPVSYTHLDVYKRQPLTDLHQNQKALRSLQFRDVCKKIFESV